MHKLHFTLIGIYKEFSFILTFRSLMYCILHYYDILNEVFFLNIIISSFANATYAKQATQYINKLSGSF